MNRFFSFIILLSFFVFQSCGNSDRLEIKGTPEAVNMTESMLKALGGKKAWQKLNSVYIRTIVRVASEGEPYFSEEWTNLNEPKFMNKRSEDNTSSINIIDGNDGWHIQGARMEMIPPQRVTAYLRWYDQYFLRVVKQIALEDEKVEVRKTVENQLEVFINDKFAAGFELNSDNLPEKYYTRNSGGKQTTLHFKEYSEYKGYKFPLEIQVEAIFASYHTDYFDPSHLEVEKAFNVSFDPNKIIQ